MEYESCLDENFKSSQVLIECEKAASQLMRYTRKNGKRNFIFRFLSTLKKLFKDCGMKSLYINFIWNSLGVYGSPSNIWHVYFVGKLLKVETPEKYMYIDIFSRHRSHLRQTYINVFSTIINDMRKLYPQIKLDCSITNMTVLQKKIEFEELYKKFF